MSAIELEVNNAGLRNIFARDTEIETIASGFQFLEGPAWHPYERHLRFSDILANTTYQWAAAAGLSVYRANSHMATTQYLRPPRALSQLPPCQQPRHPYGRRKQHDGARRALPGQRTE